MGIALQDLGVGNAQGTYMRDDKGFFFWLLRCLCAFAILQGCVRLLLFYARCEQN